MLLKRNKNEVISKSIEQPSQSKVIISIGKSYYLVDYGINICINGRCKGTLYQNSKISIPITEPSILKFENFINMLLNKPELKITVQPNTITEIKLEWQKTDLQIVKYKRYQQKKST